MFKMSKPVPLTQQHVTRELYLGTELLRNAGLPEGRFRAYALPSLQGSRRVTPTHHAVKEESK